MSSIMNSIRKLFGGSGGPKTPGAQVEEHVHEHTHEGGLTHTHPHEHQEGREDDHTHEH